MYFQVTIPFNRASLPVAPYAVHVPKVNPDEGGCHLEDVHYVPWLLADLSEKNSEFTVRTKGFLHD